jgi:hypothetical protein
MPNPVPDEWVKPEELPDLLPVFPAGGVKADADGNVWVQTISLEHGADGLAYDVIDRKGRVIDRVQLPPGAAVVGFARGGIVFTAQRDGNKLRILRSRLTRPKVVSAARATRMSLQ